MRFSLVVVLSCFITASAAHNTCDALYIICGKNYCSQPSSTLNVDGLSYDYSDINAISFGDFTHDIGDTEGRVATKGIFYANVNGVSIGDKLPQSAATPLKYSLIAGGAVTWKDGNVDPVPDARIFAGQSFSGDTQLALKATGSCQAAGCLDAGFDTMKTYFTSASSSLASKTANTNSGLVNEKLVIDCIGTTSDVYFIATDVTTLNTATEYEVNCPPSASFVFNVAGSGVLTFKGNSFPHPSNVYNIIAASQVNVGVSVKGSILAPLSTYSQTAGRVTGQTVALTYTAVHQINIPECPPAMSTTGARNGGGIGDPMIIGFDQNLRFWFNGFVGGIFNLYNDEYVNVNSRFAQANEKNGTVMEIIAVEVGGHKISFDIGFPHDKKHMNFILDGKNVTVKDKEIMHLDGCVEIGMKAGNPKGGFLSIRTPVHDAKIKLGFPTADGYITINHLDFDITPPKKNHHQVGGVIGQTASGKSSKSNHFFSVEDLYGTEKSHYFKNTPFKC